MYKIKVLCIILIITLSFKSQVFGNLIEIKVQIQDEIITNVDIENEKRYLFFLNPKLKDLEKSRTNIIARDSLINEIIKKKELKKYFNFDENKKIIDVVERNFFLKKNIKNKDEFLIILKNLNLEYETIQQKLYIEGLWNRLIYQKYSGNVVINKKELKQNIQDQINKEKKKFSYNLSEIFFESSLDGNLKQKTLEIKKSIKKIGFENTANIYSISNTSSNGGLIGWINELQISTKIIKDIKKLRINEISQPIKLQNGYILIKLNDKRELKQKINLENELKKLIKNETNRQLNNFSTIFYKRLKKNIEINEY